jgi:hypothetical protein
MNEENRVVSTANTSADASTKILSSSVSSTSASAGKRAASELSQ